MPAVALALALAARAGRDARSQPYPVAAATSSLAASLPVRPRALRALAAPTMPGPPASIVAIASASPVPVPASVPVPDAPAPDAPPTALPHCIAHRAGAMVDAQLRVCPASVTGPVLAWQPDALVVLGGGIHPGGVMSCSTMQRGWTAARLFEALGRRPALVLSGRGRTSRLPRALDDAEARCAEARWRTRARRAGASAAERALAAARAAAEQHSGRLSEAEHLCAAVLREYPGEQWPAVLARMVFEPDSADTAENATRSTELLRAGRYRRVLVVTSPAVRGRAPAHHAPRALAQFRAARAGAGYALAAIDCAFADAGPDWLAFEPRARPQFRAARR